MPDITLTPGAVWALAIAIVGSGTIGRWLASRFRAGQNEELGKTFATLKELNEWGGKVMGIHRVAELANEQAEAALAAATRAETRIDYLERQILPRLDKMTERLAEQGEAIAAQTAVLEHLVQDMRRKP